jgi:RNA polymerase sigma factor (TIGR02999 family)
MTDVTNILGRIEDGDPSAAEKLLPLVYEELRRLAAAKMAQEKPGHTLEATALVHEAYLRLVDVEQAQKWDSRRHFFSAAAEAMRRILVERARKQTRQKHGGGARRIELDDGFWKSTTTPEQLLMIDESLSRLSLEDPIACEVVKLRFFAGMSVAEAADSLGIHRATANRHWAYARAWIRAEAQTRKAADG